MPPTAIPFDRAQPDNRGDFELMAAGSWPSQISSTPQNPISRPATQTGDFILPRRPQQLGSVDFTTRAPSLWSPVIPESWWLRAGDEQPISLDSTTTNGPSVEISESTAELNTSTNNNIEPEGARRLEPNTAQESPTRSIMDLGQNTMTSWENLPTTTDYGGIERPAAWVGRSILPPINDGQTSTSREPRSQVIGRVENQSNRQQTAMPINMFIPRTGGGVQQLSYQRAPNQARPSGS